MASQVQALVLESLGVDPMELGSILCIRWNVTDRGTATWRVSIMDAATHEGTIILMEDCAYRVLRTIRSKEVATTTKETLWQCGCQAASVQ